MWRYATVNTLFARNSNIYYIHCTSMNAFAISATKKPKQMKGVGTSFVPLFDKLSLSIRLQEEGSGLANLHCGEQNHSLTE